jgi:hypothetical protein
MSIKLYGQLESDGARLVVRVLGHKVGTADGWFHWDGWAIVAANFTPDDGLAKFFPDIVVAPALSEGATVLGLMVDFYSGQIALIEMPAKTQMTNDPRVIAEAHIAV